MWKDSIVEEVRNAGKKLCEKCDNDIHKFGQLLKIETEESKKAGWKVVKKEEINKEK